MQVDFSAVEDADTFVPIAPGSYLCRIGEVRESLTRDGHPRWAFRLDVADGDQPGVTAAWDALIWSERGLPRVKQVLALLGFDVTGKLEIASADLVGRLVRAQVLEEEWDDPNRGKVIRRNRVPYNGYERVDDQEDRTAPF